MNKGWLSISLAVRNAAVFTSSKLKMFSLNLSPQTLFPVLDTEYKIMANVIMCNEKEKTKR